MSGIAKSIKKVWRPIERLGSKITNVATLGLHNKTKKIRHKIIKSKLFKVVVAAAAIYFGGAALMSMAGGGTASAGIGSAWAGAQGAGSALMAGNFSGAASALGSGFTAAGATQATTFAAGQAAAQSAISANLANAAASGAAATLTTNAAPTSTSLATPGLESMKVGAKLGLDTTAQSLVGQGVTETAKTGLLAGLGDASKAALITSGVNLGGQMIQGYAQQKQAEEQAENRDYFGVNGKGDKFNIGGPGLLNISAGNPVPQLKPLSSLDDLIAKQQQTVNAYKQWGA